MGLSQVSSAYYYKESSPNFSRFSTIGLINTSSAKQKITDSAAGATAFASGVKSYNGAIGVDSDTISVPTIIEIVSDKGWNTGVISTSSITHATPASFYAHQRSRRMADEIAAQLAESPVDFIAGGGLEYFSGNIDNQNSFEALQTADFEVHSDTITEKMNLDKRQIFLMAEDGMPRMLDGRGAFLSQAFTKGSRYLDNKGGSFFMMVEGSQIDWGGHDNDADYLITELLDFDATIGEVLDYAQKDGNTLVIVTADHETGGFTLGSNQGNYNEIAPSFSTGGHSTTLIPVFAYGPGSELFGGIYQNTDIYHKMMQAIER